MKRRPPRSTRTYTLFPYPPLFRSSRAGCGGIRRSVAAAIEAGRQFGRLRDATCPGRLTTAQAEALRLSPDSPTLDEGPGWFASALAVAPERGTCEVSGTAIETLAWGERGKPGLLFLHGNGGHADWRSEESRVGKGGVSTGRTR